MKGPISRPVLEALGYGSRNSMQKTRRRVKAELRSPYQVGEMRLRLQKLQAKDQWAREVQGKQGLKDDGKKDADGMLLELIN